MLDRLSQADFAESVHTTFDCRVTPEQPLALELVEVRSGRSSPRQEQFALLFCGPLATPLAQGMYPLRHAQLGEFDLFLVPVGKDGQGYYYEAVFNRLLPAAG
jgi:hypothetical protein